MTESTKKAAGGKARNSKIVYLTLAPGQFAPGGAAVLRAYMAEANSAPTLPMDMPIMRAPAKVRRHGLCDTHSRPLVGKRYPYGFKSWRTSPERAWQKPYLELRAANTFPALILDCDDPERAVLVLADGGLPQPSWIVTSRESGHHHAVWTLECPVHRYPEAKPKPLALFRRTAEYYGSVIGADPGYSGVLTRNPMAAADPRTVTTWGRKEAYGLTELARVIPLGWRAPKVALTGVGRNVDMFSALMRWAGRNENRQIAVLTAAETVNQAFADEGRGRLPISEVRATAKKVEAYRDKWERNGWHKPSWLSKQRARGRMSGETPKRGPVRSSVDPDKGTNELLRPWVKAGISRAWWYRLRQRRKEAEAAGQTRVDLSQHR